MPPVHLELAPAKLTRSLRVTGRRDDGYHLLEAEMATVDLADRLSFDPDGDGLEVVDAVAWLGPASARATARAVPAGPDNLVARALALVGRSAGVRLEKHIPAAAGLGGGSADAAAVLRWAEVGDLALAARLGADVPFCLAGGRAVVRGVGEVVEPLAFEPFAAVLVTPPLELATAAVYAAYDELGAPKGERGNDLEPAALAVEPRLERWRALVGEAAGGPTRLAGSGSTLFVECEPTQAAALADEVRAAVTAELARSSTGARALVTGALGRARSGVGPGGAPLEEREARPERS